MTNSGRPDEPAVALVMDPWPLNLDVKPELHSLTLKRQTGYLPGHMSARCARKRRELARSHPLVRRGSDTPTRSGEPKLQAGLQARSPLQMFSGPACSSEHGCQHVCAHLALRLTEHPNTVKCVATDNRTCAGVPYGSVRPVGFCAHNRGDSAFQPRVSGAIEDDIGTRGVSVTPVGDLMRSWCYPEIFVKISHLVRGPREPSGAAPDLDCMAIGRKESLGYETQESVPKSFASQWVRMTDEVVQQRSARKLPGFLECPSVSIRVGLDCCLHGADSGCPPARRTDSVALDPGVYEDASARLAAVSRPPFAAAWRFQTGHPYSFSVRSERSTDAVGPLQMGKTQVIIVGVDDEMAGTAEATAPSALADGHDAAPVTYLTQFHTAIVSQRSQGAVSFRQKRKIRAAS
jgi:hypothetical protein